MAVQCVRTCCRSPAHLKCFKSQVVCDIHLAHTNKRRGKQEGEAAVGERAWGDRLLTDTSTSAYRKRKRPCNYFPTFGGKRKSNSTEDLLLHQSSSTQESSISPRFHSWINEVPRGHTSSDSTSKSKAVCWQFRLILLPPQASKITMQQNLMFI